MSVKCPNCQHENPDDTLYCGRCAEPLKSAEKISMTKTFVTPVEALQKGSTIAGRYEIQEELGRGGMGVVYRAEDTKLKRTVALKFLPPELTHISEFKDRFMREAQAAAALDHPNICTVYEFDEAEEKIFISMAYIEGQSLRKRVESGPLELDLALRIATQVASGLQIAHKKGVVHRDIKSANIMVTEDNQAKIMDFGLARISGTTLLTQEGSTMGTIAYMSPEQAQGKEVDFRTDVWSLGIVLHEIFTGELPFQGDREQAVIYSILKENPKPISDLRPEIPVSIGQVVSKALEKDPENRYQQVGELLDDLKSILAGIIPEEIKVRLRKATLLRRKRAILYAGGAGLVIILLVLALTLFKGRAEAIESIAVLPLQNLTGDVEKEYFVDGMTDELIGQLAQISGLQRIISRTSVMRYKDTDKPLPEIARELNVDALVEGTVYQVGEKVRIRLQLIDVLPEERNLWTQTYEKAANDVKVMYNEMARTIAENIHVKLTANETTRFAGAPQVNPQAYEAYLKGMSHLYRLTPPEIDAALHYFEQALEIEPDYALAYAGIAFVWTARQQMGLVIPSEATLKAKEAAKRALELDDTLPEVHYTWAAIKTWNDWDWEEGEQAFKRALEIRPNYPDALVYYSNLLCYMGRLDEALAKAEQAVQLDPLNSIILTISGCSLSYLRRYDDSIERAQNALRTSPNDPVAYNSLWETYHAKGMYEESLESAKAFFSGLGMAPIAEAMAQGYEEDGYSGAMTFAAETLEAFSKQTYISPYSIAMMYALAGNKEKTIELLEIGYEMRDPMMPYISIFTFDLLDDDPRYKDLLQRMNLPEEQ